MKRTVTLSLFLGALLLPGSVLRAPHAWAADTGNTSIDVAALRIPDSAFAPAIIEQGADGEASNTASRQFAHHVLATDDPHWLPIVYDLHDTSYDALNRVDGWYQHASFGRLYFDSLDSVFRSSADAQEAMREGLESTARETPPDSCYSLYQVPCYMTTFLVTALPNPQIDKGSPPAPTARVFYAVLRFNQCLVETQAETPDTLSDAYPRDMIQGTMATMLRAGFTQAQHACSDPSQPLHKLDFSIVQVRAENTTAGAAYNLTKPGMQDTTVGSPVNLAVYFNVRDMWPGSQAIADFTVRRGTGVHFFYQSRPMQLPNCPDTYRVIVRYVPRSAGKDFIVGSVSIGGVSAQSVTILPVFRVGHAPGAPRAAVNTAPTRGEHTTTLTTVHESGSPFSLAVSSLPTGSQLRSNGAADNAVAARSTVPHLSTRSLGQEGRTGGYLVDSVQANGGHPVYTEYLVSQFGSAAQADAAFGDQRNAYQRLSSTDPSHYVLSSPGVRAGDHEAFAYSVTSVGGRPFYTGELYFTRGKVLVQAVQSYYVSDADPWGRHATPYLYNIATKLDSLSRSSQ